MKTPGQIWYTEQLRDPRWQRKRLEVMQRDDFACVTCKDVTTELHIDHKFYIKGASPWEYPDDALQTLCRNCHEIKSEIEGSIKVKIPSSGAVAKRWTGYGRAVFLAAVWASKAVLKAQVMRLYERGRLPAGSVERIFTKRGLKDS
jgi:hypothetical protein